MRERECENARRYFVFLTSLSGLVVPTFHFFLSTSLPLHQARLGQRLLARAARLHAAAADYSREPDVNELGLGAGGDVSRGSLLARSRRSAGAGFVHLLAAAQQDTVPEAQFDVAACYKDGRGCEANEEQALHWLRKATAHAQSFMETVVGGQDAGPTSSAGAPLAAARASSVPSLPGLSADASYTRIRVDALRARRQAAEKAALERRDAAGWQRHAERAAAAQADEEARAAERAAAARRAQKRAQRLEEQRKEEERGVFYVLQSCRLLFWPFLFLYL